MNAIHTHSAARPATPTGRARSRRLNGLGLAWLLAVFSSAPLSASAQTGFSAGYHWSHASLGVRHLSNGGLKGKNIGESRVFVASTL